MASKSTLFIVYMLYMLISLVLSETVLVESPFGTLEGLKVTTENKGSYAVFRGIPYAKPPVGELRFSKPEPHPKLSDPFDATKETVMCPQPQHMLFLEEQEGGVEDYLVLNVYAKNPIHQNPAMKKKVIVFVHGGGFISGAGKEYDPGTFVVEQDVIFVTINYRLSVLGFLSTENDASLGNYGMWDQLLAIQWVKENILAFGGDPKDITVAGESAGAAAVSILSVSPAAKGLFSKVHPMSGTSGTIFAIAQNPQLHALQVARAANCWNGDVSTKLGLEDSRTMMDCLRKRPLSELLKFKDFSVSKAQFVPTVDGELLPASPHILIKNEHYLDSVGFFERSYLFGVDNNEKGIMNNFVEMTENAISNINNTTQENKNKMISEFRDATYKFYLSSRLGHEEPSENLTSRIISWYDRRVAGSSLSELITDLSFLIPTYDFLQALSDRNSKQVYLVYFNYYPSFMKGGLRGMVHGVDLAFWFNMDLNDLERMIHGGLKGELDEEDLEVKAIFSSIIGEFVKTGNPANAMKYKLPTPWPPYDNVNSQYLDLNLYPLIQSHLEREKRELWMTKIPAWVGEIEQPNGHTEL